MSDPHRDSGAITLPSPAAKRSGRGGTPVAVSWSGGKDAALAIWELSRDSSFHPAVLLSTLVASTDALQMHGVPRTLVDAQAEALGLPVRYVRVPLMPSNEEYEAAMQRELLELRRAGIRHVAFGDLFLEDIKAYRDRLLAPLGMTALYPLWGRETSHLAEEFLDAGFQAIVVCTNPAKLDTSFCGREYDREFLRDLPHGVDPCGENGEFHTFVHGGPVLKHSLNPTRSSLVERDGFWYCELT